MKKRVVGWVGERGGGGGCEGGFRDADGEGVADREVMGVCAGEGDEPTVTEGPADAAGYAGEGHLRLTSRVRKGSVQRPVAGPGQIAAGQRLEDLRIERGTFKDIGDTLEQRLACLR